MKNQYGEFINIKEEEDEYYYHIQYDEVSKINIIIDYQVTSFSYLFSNCKCIESINFKKIYINNITNMSGMFYEFSYFLRIKSY